jgi:hypothetical protein
VDERSRTANSFLDPFLLLLMLTSPVQPIERARSNAQSHSTIVLLQISDQKKAIYRPIRRRKRRRFKKKEEEKK